jgi:1-acyl-sn-glycerol-3-phosphate acyltransferase
MWMHRSCMSVLRALDVECKREGNPPTSGLLVANHLSYLDIVALAAQAPCSFVSKIEVQHWPIFGMLAKAGGTIFLNRRSRTSAARAASAISQRLASSVCVALFPEGTSTDGSTVRHFHPWLFEPAIVSRHCITAASILYLSEGGGDERDLCWFGDASFLPHLWSLLCGERITVQIRFGHPRLYAGRILAAAATRESILEMRAAGSEPRDEETEPTSHPWQRRPA